MQRPSNPLYVGSNPTGCTNLKYCKRCDTTKPISEFSTVKTGERTGKVNSYCKSCMSAQSKERQRALKTKAVEYKGGRCEECGIVDRNCIYDFHHRDPSQKDFSMGNVKSLKWSVAIQNELDKCLLLCSNCHRKRHSDF